MTSSTTPMFSVGPDIPGAPGSLDPEDDYFPLEGTLVAFSLSLDRMAACYDHPNVKSAFSCFEARKYLGIVHGAYDTPSDNDGLRLFPVANRLKGEDFVTRRGRTDLLEWHLSKYVKLCEVLEEDDNGRPSIEIKPDLPWKNCIVYTMHTLRTELGRLHSADSQYRITTQEDFDRLVNTSMEDGEAVGRARREQLEKQGTKISEKDLVIEISTPAHESVGLAALQMPLRVILDLWEDLSDIKEVPYPGDFEEEVDQLQKVLQSAYTMRRYEDEEGEVWYLPEQNEVSSPTHSEGTDISDRDASIGGEDVLVDNAASAPEIATAPDEDRAKLFAPKPNSDLFGLLARAAYSGFGRFRSLLEGSFRNFLGLGPLYSRRFFGFPRFRLW